MIRIKNKKNNKNDKKVNQQITKLEKKELYTAFNEIKGISVKENIIINEFGEYILILKCLNFKSLKYIIFHMSEFGFKEIQIFVLNKEYYASLKFDNVFADNQKEKKFKNVIEELNIRKNEFAVLNIFQILTILRNKVYREDLFSEKEYKIILKSNTNSSFIKNKKNDYVLSLKNKIFAKNVLIKDDYIIFNNKNTDNQIKHQIIGLQMYPSTLYEGFLSEINHLENIETTTYIKTIDLEKVKKNIDIKKFDIISNYINSLEKLYNTCFYIHIWGTDEEIKSKKKIVLEIANKYHVILNEYFMQQKRAFCAFLPLMNNNIKSYRAIANINGILPFNEDIIKYFDTKMKYGIEAISGSALYFERQKNGIILSSNRESKRRFIQNERNHIAVDLKLYYKVVDFEFDADNEYSEYLFNGSSKFSDADLLKILKMYSFLCLGAYRENNTIEKYEKELLNEAFEKINAKISKYNFTSIKELLFAIIDQNKILTKKLSKYFDKPTESIVKYINNIFRIFLSFSNENKEYIYIYNIQNIINCLDVLAKEIFTRKTKCIYLLSSYNDFMLLNNEDVSRVIFNASYINIIDIKPNDLSFINNYLDLPDKDLVHLRNKNNITGALYTDLCEFNYYIKKEAENGNI